MKKIQIQTSLVITNISQCAEILKDALLKAKNEIQVDLADVEDCDSSGVQLLISAHKSAMQQNKSMRFDAISESVQAAFSIAGVEDMNVYLSTER